MLREVLFAGGGVGGGLGSAVKCPLKSGVISVQKNTEATSGAGEEGPQGCVYFQLSC